MGLCDALWIRSGKFGRAWRSALVIVAGVIWAGPICGQERQKRILFLYPDSKIPAVLSFAEGVRKKLSARSTLQIRPFDEFLDLSRFPTEVHKQRTLRHLVEKYGETELDVVLALGPDALRIAIDNRAILAPGAQIVFCCVSPATMATIDRPADATGIISEFNVSKTIELARRLQPSARDLVVIAGAAPFDRRWVEIARKQLDLEGQFKIRYLVGLPREELLREVGKLSRDTIAIILSIFRDGAGREFVPADIAEEVAKASSAPVYYPYNASQLRGIVGGHSDSFEEIGAQTGALILRVLDGEDPRKIPPQMSTTPAFRVDARELERWNLAESNLPPNTIVMFKTPGLWEQHRRAVLTTGVLFVSMMTVITLLVIQIRRRLKAETRLRESEERQGFAAASANIGLWQYDASEDRVWSSEHCCAMFGLAPGLPVTVETLVGAVHPDDRQIAVASLHAATGGNLADGVSEFRVLEPDGAVRWLQARGRTSFDKEGKLTRVSGIFRDITSYKAALLEAQELSQRVMTVQDEERQRIAQELHDSTVQHIAAAGLNLMALKATNGRKEPAKMFESIEGSLQEASRELRAFTYLLHPPSLATDGLTATLHRYIDGFRRRTGLKITLKLSDIADQLSSPLQQASLRIIQEALANVHRHASATRATVNLRRITDRLHLVVTDDGRGCTSGRLRQQGPAEPLPTGVGITGMSARARHFGGTLDFRRRPSGTIVHVVIPIPAKRPGDGPSHEGTDQSLGDSTELGSVASPLGERNLNAG